MDSDALKLALTAFATLRTPANISRTLRSRGLAGISEEFDTLPLADQDRLRAQAEDLAGRSVGVVFFGDASYPVNLIHNDRPVAPILFWWGKFDLFHAPGVGMCGSRAASALGLKAASSCGEEVSRRKMSVISGYAKGVDTETHLAALRNGGDTVIVLAEGFNHFRVKKSFAQDFDPARVLVISQFAPTQPWGAYAAMARNKIIFGLGQALVVVEAGERGGTRAAGEDALAMGRQVLVLDFGTDNPAGNVALLEAGGLGVESVTELGLVLDKIRAEDHKKSDEPRQSQLPL